MRFIVNIIASIVIAAAIIFTGHYVSSQAPKEQNRYQLVPDASAWQVWKIDTFTGKLERCTFVDGDPASAYVACWSKNKPMQVE